MLYKIKEKINNNRKLNRAIVVMCSLLVGVANGFFGGGGGMLVVPIFTLLCALAPNKAHATAVATILPLSLVSAIIYIIKGNFLLLDGLTICSGVIVGGIVGAIFLKKISGVSLQIIFYALMLVAGVRLLF